MAYVTRPVVLTLGSFMKTFCGSRAFLFFFLAFGMGCGVKTPKVTDENLQKPSIDHVKFTGGCPECHEGDRLPPNQDISADGLALTTRHGFGNDCVQCHSFPDFSTLKANVLAHNPYPTDCLGCHSVQINAAPHAPRGNCGGAACHAFGGPGSFKNIGGVIAP